jgi:hypothetical protein
MNPLDEAAAALAQVTAISGVGTSWAIYDRTGANRLAIVRGIQGQVDVNSPAAAVGGVPVDATGILVVATAALGGAVVPVSGMVLENRTTGARFRIAQVDTSAISFTLHLQTVHK